MTRAEISCKIARMRTGRAGLVVAVVWAGMAVATQGVAAGGGGLSVPEVAPGAAAMEAPLELEQARPFVSALYVDVLGRFGGPAEVAFWTDELTSGRRSQYGVAIAFASSAEWLGKIVRDLYLGTLGRPPDSGGLSFWVNELRSGRASVPSVSAQFYASPEYFQRSGGTTSAWITDLYRQILHRDPDAGGLEYWVNRTAQVGRVAVAFDFFQSVESRRDRVARLYQALLARSPDAGGHAYWADRILGEGDVVLAAFLLSSPEYIARAGTRFNVDGTPTSDFTAIATGAYHSCALRTNGTVACWGGNYSGQLGDGTTTGRLTPVPVVGLSDATAIAPGGGHSCALRTNGTVACWGDNFYGQVGDGTTTGRLTPVPVAG